MFFGGKKEKCSKLETGQARWGSCSCKWLVSVGLVTQWRLEEDLPGGVGRMEQARRGAARGLGEGRGRRQSRGLPSQRVGIHSRAQG